MNILRKLARRMPRTAAFTPGRLSPPAPRAADDASMEPGTLVFRCNICSARTASPMQTLDREHGNCTACDANMRSRSMIHLLATGLFGESLPLADFPAEASTLTGIGMSDSYQYASRLERLLRYTNTFYHQDPRLDIQDPAPQHLGGYDFVLCSDVFEHVDPPVEKAFANLRRVLRPGGLLVFSVPFAIEGDTIEHFPELYDYRIVLRNGIYVLINRTADGREQEFSDLVFHGGPGSTLELRLFSEPALRRELEAAGFEDVTVHRQPCFPWGIFWDKPWSVPLTARAG